MAEDKFYKLSRLSSGLTVLTEEVPSVRSVALGFWIKVGSKKEPLNLLGISHFIEHLVFKGSKKYSARQISEIFDSLGGEINAFTSKEYTCFYTRLLDEHIPRGLEVLSDMLENPLFKEKDIKSEKKVVFEEIAMYEDTPDEKIHDLFASVVFKGHPLSKNVLGKKETLLSIQRDDLFSFYRSHYTPKNTVLVASGHISHEELIEHTLPALEENSNPVCEEKVSKEEVPELYIEEKETEQMHLCIGAKVFAANHPKRFALAILDTILGGGMSSRLFQEIREKRGLAYSVYSYHTLYSDSGLFAVYVGTSPKQARTVISLVREEISKITRDLKQKEIRKAKDHLKGHLVLSLESTSSRMNRLGKAYLSQGEALSIDELIEKLENVTLEEIAEVAEKWLSPEKLIIVGIGPSRSSEIAS